MARFNQPLGGNDMPRYTGHATMFRLPAASIGESVPANLVFEMLCAFPGCQRIR